VGPPLQDVLVGAIPTSRIPTALPLDSAL
jgi:hypothetical protein